MSCRNLKVATFDVSRTKPVPDLRGPISIPFASNALASPDASDLGILKWREDPGHQSGRPGDIIISHDCDGRFNLGKRLANLDTLVGD